MAQDASLSFARAVELAAGRLQLAAAAPGAGPRLCPVTPEDLSALAARVAEANEMGQEAAPESVAAAGPPLPLRTRADAIECAALAFVQLEDVQARERLLGRQQKLAARLMEMEQRRVRADVDPALLLTQAKTLRARTRLEAATLEEAGVRARQAMAALTGLETKGIAAEEGSMPALDADGTERGAPRLLALGRDTVQLEATAEYQARQRAVHDAALGKGGLGALVAAEVREQIRLAALTKANDRLREARIEALAETGALEAWAVGQARRKGAEARAGGEEAELVSLILAPAEEELAAGRPQQFSAIATFANGRARDVTAEAEWSCAQETRAVLSTTGLLTGLWPGEVTIRVSYRGNPRSLKVRITEPPAEELPGTAAEGR